MHDNTPEIIQPENLIILEDTHADAHTEDVVLNENTIILAAGDKCTSRGHKHNSDHQKIPKFFHNAISFKCFTPPQYTKHSINHQIIGQNIRYWG